jgi:hypothetical protein
MACFAVFRGADAAGAQVLAAALKVPALFLLTLVVTFPSLYVFNALVGSRLSLLSVLRLLIAGMAVMLAVLASFGPIVAFFSASTTSYPFMQLLNVVVFSIAGLLGLKFLLHTLPRLTMAQEAAAREEAEIAVLPAGVSAADAAPTTMEPGGALDRIEGQDIGRDVVTVFRIWVVVFGLVGAQMAWVLRPFIGAPDIPFAWLRDRESNFFEAVVRALGQLLGAG